MLEALTTTEDQHLMALESTIQSGLAAFMEVASALSDIKINRLYRQNHESFEQYCWSRWSISVRRANQLIVAREAVKSLPEPQQAMIPNEHAAATLHTVPAPERAEVVEEVAKQGPVTARKIKETMKKRVAKAPKLTIAEKKKRTMELQAKLDELPRGGVAADKQRREVEKELSVLRGEAPTVESVQAALDDPRPLVIQNQPDGSIRAIAAMCCCPICGNPHQPAT